MLGAAFVELRQSLQPWLVVAGVVPHQHGMSLLLPLLLLLEMLPQQQSAEQQTGSPLRATLQRLRQWDRPQAEAPKELHQQQPAGQHRRQQRQEQEQQGEDQAYP